jgi:hypothetical protein
MKTVNLPISRLIVGIVISSMNHQTMNFANMGVGSRSLKIALIAHMFTSANIATRSVTATIATLFSGVKTATTVERVITSQTVCLVRNVSDV